MKIFRREFFFKKNKFCFFQLFSQKSAEKISEKKIKFQWATDQNFEKIPQNKTIKKMQRIAEKFLGEEFFCNGKFGEKTATLFSKLCDRCSSISCENEKFFSNDGESVFLSQKFIDSVLALEKVMAQQKIKFENLSSEVENENLQPGDRDFDWAPDQNFEKIPRDDFLRDLQIRIAMFLHQREGTEMTTNFTGRFGKITRAVFLKFFSVAKINFDKKDFVPEKKIILRKNIIEQILNFDFPEIKKTEKSKNLEEHAEKVKKIKIPEKKTEKFFDAAKDFVNKNVEKKTIEKILQVAESENIPPRILLALMSTESRLKPGAKNKCGYRGLGQLKTISIFDTLWRGFKMKKKTAAREAFKIYKNPAQIFAATENAILTARYFKLCCDAVGLPRDKIKNFNLTHFNLVYLAYNQGVGKVGSAVKKYKKRKRKNSMQFTMRDVENIWKMIKISGPNPKNKILELNSDFWEDFTFS